jgi:hypothetical protein
VVTMAVKTMGAMAAMEVMADIIEETVEVRYK